ELFRASKDQRLVVVGLTFQAVAQAADRDFDTAQTSLLNAGFERERLPADLLQISGWLSEIHGLTGDVLALGVPNPEACVAGVHRLTLQAWTSHQRKLAQ